MLDELAVFYHEDDSPVLPFIIAPIAEQQDTLIVAPQRLAQVQDRFLNAVFGKLPQTRAGSLHIRVFSYESSIAIVLVFPTNLLEEKSMRPGLTLTLGALVERRVFREYRKPTSSYFHHFIRSLNLAF